MQGMVIPKIILILMGIYFLYCSIGRLFYIYCVPQRSDSEFEGFDNNTGVERQIIPNIVHFLVTSPKTGVTFLEAICMLAALKNQNPDHIYVHTDLKQLTGQWELLMKIPEFKKKVVLKNVTVPVEIFGQQLNPYWREFHASDLLRISMLMEFGGIFLDNDSFLVKSMDPLRRFEMVLGLRPGSFLGTQVLIAHRDARFLRLWYDSYKTYRPWQWYWNAGEKPTKDILYKRPELIHNVENLLGVERGFPMEMVFYECTESWKLYYSIHLLRRFMPTIEYHNYTLAKGSIRPMIESVVNSFPIFNKHNKSQISC